MLTFKTQQKMQQHFNGSSFSYSSQWAESDVIPASLLDRLGVKEAKGAR